MENEKIKAFITKYALTDGVVSFYGEVHHDISNGRMFSCKLGCIHGKDWHRTPEAALFRAEEMRKAKLISLRKSIAKIEAMEFKIKE